MGPFEFTLYRESFDMHIKDPISSPRLFKTSHLRCQGAGSRWNIAASVTGSDWDWVFRVVVLGHPVVLGVGTDTWGLDGLNGHQVVVSSGVQDGGHVVA